MEFKSKFIKNLAICALFLVFNANAAAMIKSTCTVDQGPGFWFYQNNSTGLDLTDLLKKANMGVRYTKATQVGDYNNSQLAGGAHCLPLPAEGAKIEICGRNGIFPSHCRDFLVDVHDAVSVSCHSNDLDFIPHCGWSTQKRGG
jgi:hypothetical protein